MDGKEGRFLKEPLTWTRSCTVLDVMAHCYQCGIQTSLYQNGSAVCAACSEKVSGERTISELNARLNAARDEYRRAMGARREAFEFKRTLDHPDGSIAMQNANFQVELTSTKFREALREFVTALARPTL
jgi:uncharacterized Zn finger protein (UPF0148 family)